MPKGTLAPNTLILSSKSLEKLPKTLNTELGRFDPISGRSSFSRGRLLSYPPCAPAGQGGAPPPDEVVNKISRPATAGRTRIGPVKAAAVAILGHQFSAFFGHFRPTHTSLPPFLDPLNSFPWSIFADSSPFERYDKNKVR